MAENMTPAAQLRAYFFVFGALLALTLTTVLVAHVHLPPGASWLHTPLALAIAAAKATMVVLIFMHVWGSPRLIYLVIGAALLTLGVFLTLTFSDYVSRT